MVVIVCALLAVGAIGFTLVVRDRDIPPAPVENPEMKHLETRRQVLYDNLKDLQFEYHQGKLSEGDYQSLKAGFLSDLAVVMDSLERLQHGKAKKERESGAPEPVTKAKSKPRSVAVEGPVRICPSCAAENPATNHFCGHCGTALIR